jgi:hypothetical protein
MGRAPHRFGAAGGVGALVFDAHDKAFDFYDGACRRGIYDNMKV